MFIKFHFGLIVFPACCRASLGWFAYEPEWFDISNMNFAHSEAQSLSIFVQFLLNERGDAIQSNIKGSEHENEGNFIDVVRCS